ncbi:C-type lectin domain family 4 member E isoform X1 [Anarrhichthys ocellatus]|uniref:C-type lectin domain family 4 member E isoform X1 n=1 Tax=Anarrhichthys ocellatus TaxID=433405 RepID=UPI0012EDD316|nr:C-type lectin domain family 4 member E-like isoform X1 [Anarrhichthys ocellatus]
MEMQDIAKEKERSKEDEGASEPMLEVKIEEEAETDHYAKLQSQSEDIYSEAVHGGTPFKTRSGKQTEGNTRVYRAACLFLTIICLVLLLVIIILSMKLQTGSTVCPERAETTAVDRGGARNCSYEECLDLFPSTQAQDPSLLPHLGCRQCADGWLTFGRSCFYLSTFRLSWDESQRNCTARGGALAVVTSRKVQNFLTEKSKMIYWIGLREKGATWTWVDNTVLQESYWAEVPLEGDCGILTKDKSPENWIKTPCNSVSYFICQLQF